MIGGKSQVSTNRELVEKIVIHPNTVLTMQPLNKQERERSLWTDVEWSPGYIKLKKQGAGQII